MSIFELLQWLARGLLAYFLLLFVIWSITVVITGAILGAKKAFYARQAGGVYFRGNPPRKDDRE